MPELLRIEALRAGYGEAVVLRDMSLRQLCSTPSRVSARGRRSRESVLESVAAR